MKTSPCPKRVTVQLTNYPVPLSFAIVAITYYMAFGSPTKMSQDAFRWVYMKCGMYRVFAHGDLTHPSWMSAFKGRARKKEAEQEWERRRSEQMAKDAQGRRVAPRRGAVIDYRQTSEPVSPDTPVSAVRPDHGVQSGMLAVYQKLNNTAGKRRLATMKDLV